MFMKSNLSYLLRSQTSLDDSKDRDVANQLLHFAQESIT